jgi:hypothetical protein
MLRRLAAGLLVAAAATACGNDTGAGPSRAGLTLALPDPLEGRIVTCEGCQEPTTTVVIEALVTIGDPQGAGATLERVETVVVNVSRGTEVVRNVRPNASYAFPSTSIPAGGTLRVHAGAVLPLPPPRDEIRVTVIARASDGRTTTASAPLSVAAAAP